MNLDEIRERVKRHGDLVIAKPYLQPMYDDMLLLLAMLETESNAAKQRSELNRQLSLKIGGLTAELEAAKGDLMEMSLEWGDCSYCIHRGVKADYTEKCMGHIHRRDCWQWRGPQAAGGAEE